MAKVVVDTGVVVEYLDLRGGFHEQALEFFSALIAGRVEAILPHPILAETYYVATRLYQRVAAETPEELAARLVRWLYRLPATTVVGEDAKLALEVGRAKLTFGLALTDCYVLAASRAHACKALFRAPEREMVGCVDALRREYELLFLKDYS